ncbi:NB-ARC domain-containing protein [Nocardioides sp.]|uniref:ATP-binding protein n=1 Tax=Nocardioides sp. TaxID=35761 RepID=UPI001A2443A7|nr:NB-ARC domain-containing protein [Nocardioides sp.]MBJ7357456.1 AAA family ATPase [Nocardioides sp.]
MTWRGTPLPAGRTHALLAALVAGERSGVSEDALVAAVWEDDIPANPGKALQVVVSRTRSQTGPDVVVRTARGYRLGLAPDAVDAWALADLVDAARRAEGHGDHVGARDLAREALTHGLVTSDGPGPLADVRAGAVHDRAVATAVLGRALSVLGDHTEALPLLESAPRDDATLVELLRSEAAVRGAPAALDRYERLRADLADRLGVDPAPALRAVHAELLAADHPVRDGVRFDATSLVGRDDDLRALRALVREARVVSILGPGGLGKTRLAHVLARDAEQQVVHFVELVSVVDPADVVGEIGSALGVRDSVSSRLVLSPEQLADVRARIAQSLDQAPTLLVLDNCEQVVGAVADLVAFLVATVPGLRVVTTTRAPLSISAERVFALAQLDDDAALDLFEQRARAARPSVALPPDVARRVVSRLDGLPLAIELAAAKVRVMSVADLDRRLDDRFGLLRGHDRSKPDRHQTLLAVIEWSWALLSENERTALQRLSVFADGFTLAAAEATLGHDALDEITSLVDQSLLTVVEGSASVRYRMLETVREFGRLRLEEAGAVHDTEQAQLAWARGLLQEWSPELWGARQVEAVRALIVEENNLADCLRRSLREVDQPAVCALVAGLGGLWTITGDNARVIVLASAVDEVLAGWRPAPEEVDEAVAAAAMVVMNTLTGEFGGGSDACRAILAEHAPAVSDPRVRGTVRVLSAHDPGDVRVTLAGLAELGEGPDRFAAVQALMWVAHFQENVGDPEGAIVAATRGLERVDPDDGPWLGAMLRVVLGTLHAALGRHAAAAPYLRAALPDLLALGDHDDAIQAQALLAMGALETGDHGEAARILDGLSPGGSTTAGLVGPFVISTARAELALATGNVERGLLLYRETIAHLHALRFRGFDMPSGLEPWTLYGTSAAVTAYARFAPAPQGEDLFDTLLADAARLLETAPHLDFPVTGAVLHALGAWALLRDTASVEAAVRLLVLAELFAYTRYSPSLDPGPTEAEAETRAPGLTARVRAELDGRRGPDLVDEARAAVAAL